MKNGWPISRFSNNCVKSGRKTFELLSSSHRYLHRGSHYTEESHTVALASSSSLSLFRLWSSVLFEQRLWPCQNTLLTVRLGYEKWRVVWMLESESTKRSVRQQITGNRVAFWFLFSDNHLLVAQADRKRACDERSREYQATNRRQEQSSITYYCLHGTLVFLVNHTHCRQITAACTHPLPL